VQSWRRAGNVAFPGGMRQLLLSDLLQVTFLLLLLLSLKMLPPFANNLGDSDMFMTT
jgi:hypothetical protein